MFNNKKYINELKSENESLNVWMKFWKQSYELAKVKNIQLQADIEVKENNVCNLLEANKELSLSNNYLENKIKLLEQVVKQHEENECELNTKLCRAQGQLDKIDNYTRMLEGRGINE